MDEKKQAKPEVTELDPENLEKVSGGHGSMNPDGTYNCPRCGYPLCSSLGIYGGTCPKCGEDF